MTDYKYRKEVIDYLRDGYGVDPVLDASGRHSKLRFDHDGRTIVLGLNDRNVSGEKGVDAKLQDIRRLLGPPRGEGAAAPARTLDAMTEELEREAGKLSPPPAPSAGPPAESPPEDEHPASVALYQGNQALTLKVPDALVTGFYRGVRRRGCRVDFTAPNLWTIRHADADRPALKAAAEGWVLAAGSAATRDRLGSFRVSPATAWLRGGVIHVRLAGPLNRYGEPVHVVQAPPEPVVPPKEAPTATAAPPPKEAPTATAAPPTDEAHLRALLEQVRAVEAASPYRLIREEGAWAWRAVLTIR